MRPLVSVTAICTLSLTALAGQQQQEHPAPPPQSQTLHQLETTVLDTNTAEIHNAHATPVPNQPGASGTVETYCQATTNSQGNTASIGHSGSLVLDEHSFGLNVTGHTVHAASFGMFTYGTQPTNVPFGNGYLCISPFAPGIFRMPTQALVQPTLALSMEDAPGQFAMVTPGSSWYFQFWYRDPTAGGSNFNLSNGLHVVFAPAP